MTVVQELTRWQVSVLVVIILLVAVNLVTVMYYKSTINTLKERSSFVTITQNTDAESFKQCLKKAGIGYKVEGGEVKVREVEQSDATNICS